MMAKVWFDFSAATNGSGTNPLDPKNTLTGYTVISGDEIMMRRGGSWTGTLSMTAGTPGKKTKYMAWYNMDGSDDQSKPRPILNLSAGLGTYNSTNKDFIEFSSLDIRATGLTEASDSNVIFMGHHCAVTNCVIDTNVGGIGCYGKNNCIIAYNTISAVSHSTSFNNCCIAAADSRDSDGLLIKGNTLYHKGGGGTANSHAMKVDASTSANTLKNLVIDGNVIRPAAGASYCANTGAIGIRIGRCPDAKIMNNDVSGMLSGMFFTGIGTNCGVHIHHNKFNSNYHFGIHITSYTDGCLIEYNECDGNGTNINTSPLAAYGRAIELSGGNVQNRCMNHVIRFNVCTNTKNYGGPLDNGTEGVGIGLDDTTSGCVLYGNIITGNEGNGVQYYGGTLDASITNTANHTVANFFKDNSKASFYNRRTGGTNKTTGNAHIGLAATIGLQSIIANNVFTGTGDCGIWQKSDCNNVLIANNIFIDVPHAIAFGQAAGYGCFHNVFRSVNVTVQKYSTTAVDANSSPTYPTLAYTGTNDYTFDPLLDSNYVPKAGSPCISAGYGSFKIPDYLGRPFKASPAIGMYEDYLGTAPTALRL